MELTHLIDKTRKLKETRSIGLLSKVRYYVPKHFWRTVGYSRKNPNNEVKNTLFWKKNPGIFRFITLPLEICEKTSFVPWKFCEMVQHPRNSKVKNQDPWKFHMNFSWTTLEIPLLFLIDPWNFHRLFLQYLSKFYVLNPLPCLDFFWNSPICHSIFSSHLIYGWENWGKNQTNCYFLKSYYICKKKHFQISNHKHHLLTVYLRK